MSKLQFLIIHCTATPEGRNVTAQQVKDMHTLPKSKGGRGWSRVGYSELILLDGTIINMRPYNEDDLIDQREYTNGAVGYNMKSRHICYVGGCDSNMKAKDTRTTSQKIALENYVKTFHRIHPSVKILGHNEIAPKACPSFDVQKWLKEIGIIKENIRN